MKHILKTWPEYFEAVNAGSKTFELRKNDRGFAVGDVLLLREYRPETDFYSGREIEVKITFILRSGFGLQEGYACMAILKTEKTKN